MFIDITDQNMRIIIVITGLAAYKYIFSDFRIPVLIIMVTLTQFHYLQ